jgi:hypothetical protein
MKLAGRIRVRRFFRWFLRPGASAALLGGLASLLGCAAGGDAHAAAALVRSDSFSPSTGELSDGRPADKLWWTYLIHDGEPVHVMQAGVDVTFDFGVAEMVIEPQKNLRTVEVSANITSTAPGAVVQGTMDLRVEDQLRLGAGPGTGFVSQRLLMTERLSGEGESLELSLDLHATPSTPFDWVVDRADLGVHPIGTTFEMITDVVVGGSIALDENGEKQQRRIEDTTVTVSDVWTVIGSREAMIVDGVEYRDIVDVERRAPATNPMTGTLEQRTVTYSVAKGVGLVHGTNLASLPVAGDVTWQLLDTNLVAR